jgi:hypothetical protein
MSDSAPIVFAPMFNTRGRHDATGAFQPEADAFCRARGGTPTLIANTMPAEAMRAQVFLRLIPDPAIQVRTVAFFCHGSGGSIQFGFNRANVDQLAAAIAEAVDVRIVLYACNTARGSKAEGQMAEFGGDGGFADALRDALCRAGAVNCQVDAHTTAGHTTRNPFVRRFLGMGSRVGGVGGFWIVSPTNRPLWAKWRRALREGSLRFDFPFLSIAEIHERLTAA